MDISSQEVDALKKYVSAEDTSPGGDSYCFGLNAYLRRGLKPSELPLNLQDHARFLDGLLAREKLSKEYTVHRGIGSLGELAGAYEPGDQFRSLGYWSTSTEESATESFITGGGPVCAVITMTLNAGFPGMDLGLVDALKSFGSHEAEVLLPRGILWSIVSYAPKRGDDVPKILRSKYKTIVHFKLEPVSSTPFLIE
jgi:hypothetical protein